MPKDRDSDERQHSELAISVCALTCELAEHRKLKMEELEFLKARLATKCDIQEAKEEIIKAIEGHIVQEDRRTLDTLSKRTERITKRLEALDAKTV